jgi:integration host factor subunit beta
MPPESSKSLDTTQRPVYAVLGPRLVEGPARDAALSPAEEMAMTKAELVDQVAATVHLSKSQTDAVLTQCLQAIIEALQAGESVELRGFGRFHLRHRQARAGRNPRTGETIPIPAKALPPLPRGRLSRHRCNPALRRGVPREVHARHGGNAQ